MIPSLYCFIGESGSGKTTVADFLTEAHGIQQIISHTTRPKRYPSEKGYHFVDVATWCEHTHDSKIFEETIFNKHHYWTLKEDFTSGEDRIFICDPVGSDHVRKVFRDTHEVIAIYFKVPESMRFCRMFDRNKATSMTETDAADKAFERLHHDRKAFKMFHCDYVIDNSGTLEEVIPLVKKIMRLV